MRDRYRTAAATAALCVTFAVPMAAESASFDCAKARSKTERLICSNPDLNARDDILSKLYMAALQKDSIGRIRGAQRDWLVKADGCGTAACLADAYDRRISVLLRTEGGNEAATHFFTEMPKGNHGTLDVLGPIHGFAAVSLTSTFVGPRGVDAGDIDVGSTDTVVDLRHGPAETTNRRCVVTFHPLDARTWKVAQRGLCDLPGGTVFAGTYRRSDGDERGRASGPDVSRQAR